MSGSIGEVGKIDGSALSALTINEVCARLSVSRATVYRMIKAGQLEKITVGHRGARVPLASMAALLSSASAATA